jgi:P4 family phage/plasmid primase-like protien
VKHLTPLERAKLPMNDLGNARRVFEAARGDADAGVRLLWLADAQGGKGAWIAFDGVRWSTDEGPARALAFAQRASMAVVEEAAALREASSEELSEVFGARFTKDMADERVGQLFSWANKSGDSAKCTQALSQFKALRDGPEGPFVTQAWVRDFDADPFAYHCLNGTLRLVETAPRQWEHRFEPGHRAADRFMQVAAVAYDPEAKAPAWEERLLVMHKDPVQRTALQRIYGMTLTALISDQAFYIFQGKGQDGKSVTNDIICKLHGAYARRADPKTFLEGPSQASAAHQSDIVRLAGDIRLVVMDEPKKGSTWDGQRIKQATGSEMIARGAHATTELSFVPHWQLIVECNHLPKPPSDDRGFQRRFKLYPWVVQFGVTPGPDGKPIADEPVDVVKTRLLGELPGVLNWMIAGALEWLAERVIPKSAAAAAATASFWDVSSALGEFIKQCCDVSDPEAWEYATPLYQAFRQFCLDRGDKEDRIMQQSGFGRALNDAQIYAGDDHAAKKKIRIGIRLKSELERGGAAADVVGGEGTEGWLPAGSAADLDPFGAP